MSLGANRQTGAWRLTSGSFRDGLLYLSNFYCLPGRAGGSLFVLAQLDLYKTPTRLRALKLTTRPPAAR